MSKSDRFKWDQRDLDDVLDQLRALIDRLQVDPSEGRVSSSQVARPSTARQSSAAQGTHTRPGTLVAFPQGAVEALVGRTLRTLDRGEAFDVVKAYPSGLKLRLRSGSTQFVDRSALHLAYRLVQEDREPELEDLTRCNQVATSSQPAGGSYLAAILAQLPNVGYYLKPVKLYDTCGLPKTRDHLDGVFAKN